MLQKCLTRSGKPSIIFVTKRKNKSKEHKGKRDEKKAILTPKKSKHISKKIKMKKRDVVEIRDEINILKMDEHGDIVPTEKKYVMQEIGNTYGHKYFTPVTAACIGKKLGEMIILDGDIWVITEIKKQVVTH